MIPVTKTFLPPQEEYQAILSRAWDAGWITNRGVLVKELEEKLKSYLGVPNIIATTNGTLPLQIAIKALKLTGEIITTPFSYVATTSSIVWENCTLVFVDIDPEYLSIDDTKIEAAITSKTTGILATHVFGNPCNVGAIDLIAKKYELKVIYDAAHCFGVTYKGESIFNYGNVSTCSFHATKIFHTGEGGALFTRDEDLLHKLFYHHNFGHRGQEDFYGLGLNAKMSELQAALGLSVLPYYEFLKAERKKIITFYNIHLEEMQRLRLRDETSWNYSYFPVVFPSEIKLVEAKSALNAVGIFPRRYFYPSLNSLPYVEYKEIPIAESVSSRILCLPVYTGLETVNLEKICNILKEI
ncbi:DegT/DnrJ/EryC1/StrS family aminotransferase [Antarcticibacterium sp. 1MA-6-2]|uniref:DegT/DnrJ/EryC1/StrS family aminotransferase n=1 Tax=Antarcticibacterium sp. 1MA-6-2 TaxID=2908210 RepID=UPI001F2C94B6|nr:DegT/DnrJ/EryC1/StrS family aminotransferase [Antarcticibacterium sp. 1MA-6-2]UJH92525.1 DegT/DnrJ/EryC1/StrS family aminotransferase [Antarcticibacterium sp. 1MA-6-2]